jgi:hypothetical protein
LKSEGILNHNISTYSAVQKHFLKLSNSYSKNACVKELLDKLKVKILNFKKNLDQLQKVLNSNATYIRIKMERQLNRPIFFSHEFVKEHLPLNPYI